MTEIQIGDKVRVSYEGVVNDTGLSYLELDNGKVGVTLDNFEVEILEKAKPKDDPSKDLVGTVRSWCGVPTVKIRADLWVTVRDRPRHVTPPFLLDQDLLGSEALGAVPGTLAASAQEVPGRFKVGQRIKGDHLGYSREGIIQKTEEYCRYCARERNLSGDMYRVDSGLISYESAQLIDPWAKFQD